MLDYESSGVNIQLGNQFVHRIQKSVQSTHQKEVIHNPRGFAALFRQGSQILVSSTDGVGTKIKLALEYDQLRGIGQDLAAMVINDIIVTGAKPLFFLDYIASSQLELSIAEAIIEGLCKALQSMQVALVGGETAEMPGVYQAKEWDIAGFAVGTMNDSEWIGPHCLKDIQEGQEKSYKIMALNSSGVHSNGFSLVRNIILKKNIRVNKISAIESEHAHLLDQLLEPTFLYASVVAALKKTVRLRGLAHITGGGLIENPVRMLDQRGPWALLLNPQQFRVTGLFKWLQKEAELSDFELYRTFNSGIGLTAIIHESDESEFMATAKVMGFKAWSIGHLISKNDLNQYHVVNEELALQ